ncbi:MAG: hypothetical protein M0R76_02105 [Proteobacteria bacterium]|nr:hypothetical protein [Pseudomonadota bacterium]
MKTVNWFKLLTITAATIAALGCMNREPAPVCPVPTELVASTPTIGGFDGVDIIAMVDNSSSMVEEQQILATSFFPLINALVNPLPGAKDEGTDSIRIAIVTSDMGLQWGGNGYVQARDGFPSVLTKGCINNDGWGDNGNFITNYGFNPNHGGVVELTQGAIPCGAGAVQCPPGWTCDNIGDNGIGACYNPSASGQPTSEVSCPPAPGEKQSHYLTLGTGDDASGPPLYAQNELALATACLSKLGTDGCGFEQQLLSPAVGLERDAGRDPSIRFMRDKALLVILLVTDEEDCSMKDGPSLFATEHVQQHNYAYINVACGEHEEYLYTPAEILDRYRAAKAKVSGQGSGILFAAITGVPTASEASGCEGTGNEIGGCLDLPQMQNEIVQDPDYDAAPKYIYKYTCSRYEGSEAVTQAMPARRLIQIAQSMGSMGYVYSICNADWSPAMEKISSLIAANIAGTCYAKPLDVDPATNTAYCNTVIKFFGQDTCPGGLPWAAEEQVGTPEQPIVSCTIPKIPANPVCPDPGTPEGDALREIVRNEFGWYYCENRGEDFSDACNDGIDNDGDGLVDCEQPSCQSCKNCAADGQGDTALCPLKCRYMMTLTDKALSMAKNASVEVQCLQQFSFEDPNCQENTRAACSDGLDNDGNGPYDCVNISAGQASDEWPARNADPHCCPMSSEQLPGRPCQFTGNGDPKKQAQAICNPDDWAGAPGFNAGDWSDACKAAAALYQCTLP